MKMKSFFLFMMYLLELSVRKDFFLVELDGRCAVIHYLFKERKLNQRKKIDSFIIVVTGQMNK